MRRVIVAVIVAVFLTSGAWAAKPQAKPTPTQDKVIFQPRYQDPVMKEMDEKSKEEAKKKNEETKKIREGQKSKKEADKKDEKTLRFDMATLVKPANPEAFKPAPHLPPQAQYQTGTCWSFGTTSFFESEVARITGQKIKLSEIYPVYWEYVERMRRYLRERGDSLIAQGSEPNAVTRMYSLYGIVPAEAYRGVLAADGRHDHSRLVKEINELANWAKAQDNWDEELLVEMTRVILDREIGPVPEKFTFQGKEYTPKQFLSDVAKLNPNDYVQLMSMMSLPFYTQGEYKVGDNWWHDTSYYNLPLNEYYAAFKKAIQSGYTASIGGDVSEPGINGFEGAAIIPSFDIPQEYINQDAREFRFYNKTSTDDHIIHALGYAQAGGHDWYLIKDSGRSARHGKFEGYYFYRDDYIKLKILTFTVHKDAVKDVIAKCK